MKITVGLVDDHALFVNALPLLIEKFPGFEVVVTAQNGRTLLNKLDALPAQPDILLLDVEMAEMDGLKLAAELSRRFPLIKLVALSTNDREATIIGMLRAGCCAYLLKGIQGDELERAMLEIYRTGFYNADGSNIIYRRKAREAPVVHLNEKEKKFLTLACSDLTYRQIAAEMNMSERTIDGYRESLFDKFNVQSRVGMVLEAIRLRYVQL